MRSPVCLALACICTACWYVAICYPLWTAGVFAFSWGLVLAIDTVLDVRDALARRRAERLPRMWVN